MTALKTLLDHAEGARDQLLAALRRADQQAERVQAQADQLTVYRNEYQQRWAGQFSRRGAIEIVHCYQSFMQRLDEAVAQQQQQVDAATAACERLRGQLMAAEMRVASVRKLIERRVVEQRRAHDRHEQRQTDETAQQIRWRAAQNEPAQH